jgi:hypothetical protein
MDTEHNNKDYKLVKIYCYVCEKFEDSLQFQCERFSNNKQPKLTDQEIVTIYLFAMRHQGIFKLKQIHRTIFWTGFQTWGATRPLATGSIGPPMSWAP